MKRACTNIIRGIEIRVLSNENIRNMAALPVLPEVVVIKYNLR